MKNWTIKKRIICGFTSILLLLALLAASSVLLLRKVESNIRVILVDCLPGVTTTGQLKYNTIESYLALWRLFIAKTPDDKKQQEEIIATVGVLNNKLMADYEKSITTQEDRQIFARLQQARADFIRIRQEMLQMSAAGRSLDDALEFNKTTLHPAHAAYNEAVDALFEYNVNSGKVNGAASQAALNQARNIIMGAALMGLILGITFAIVITVGLGKALRRTARALDEGSDQVAAASLQVAAGSQSLAEGVSEQAASLEETGASLEEMSSLTRRNADNAQNAKDLSNLTRQAAETGAAEMEKMNSAMNAIKNSSDNIAKIIKTIDEIAFQTNILALNAAVEAARAGEAGMGFAVVAEEVRNLAQRSAQAARETADKIEDSIKKSESGVQISAHVSSSLQEIVTKARQVDDLLGEIATASKEQSQGIAQVNAAVVQMDKVTQSSASGAEESAGAAEELNAQAKSLKDNVCQLLALVEGDTAKGNGARAQDSPAAATLLAQRETSNRRQNGNGHASPTMDKPRGMASASTAAPSEAGFESFRS